MEHISGYIETGEEQLHYIKYGVGKRLILAFHGYGDSATFFSQLASYIQEDYTLISFSLPHHAESSWTSQKLWYKEMLEQLVTNTLEQFDAKQFSLVGYSIGGRVCMCVLELFSNRVDKLVLLASDGLRFNWFYYWLTRTMIGKFIFNSFLKNPALYMPLIDVAKKLKVLNDGKYRFAMKYISSEVDRRFLLNVWMTMSMLIPNIGKVKGLIKTEQISTELFMGRYD